MAVETNPLMTIEVKVDPPQEVGAVGGVRRRCIPIVGGTVSGKHNGVVLGGGADWQTIAPDGSLDLAARYTLKFSEGSVEVVSTGLRTAKPEVLARLDRGKPVPANEYYFRTAMRFHTGSLPLAYLNSILAVAKGERLAGLVRLTVFEVL